MATNLYKTLALSLSLLLLSSCGDSNSSGSDSYYIKVEDSSLDGVLLSGESFEQLTNEPIVERASDGSGTIRVHLRHGPWIPEFIDHLHNGTVIDAFEIVAGSKKEDGAVTEHSRTIFNSASVHETLISADDNSESVEYLFSFKSSEERDAEGRIHPQESTYFSRDTTSATVSKRYLIVGSIYGNLPFPSILTQSAVHPRNGVTAVDAYKLILKKVADAEPGLSLTLQSDTASSKILDASLSDTRLSGFDLFQVVEDSSNSRITLGFQSGGFKVGDTSLGSAADGSSIVETRFYPSKLLTYSPNYSRNGSYENSNISCVEFSSPPQVCASGTYRTF